jgi:hypothetical protein
VLEEKIAKISPKVQKADILVRPITSLIDNGNLR